MIGFIMLIADGATSDFFDQDQIEHALHDCVPYVSHLRNLIHHKIVFTTHIGISTIGLAMQIVPMQGFRLLNNRRETNIRSTV